MRVIDWVVEDWIDEGNFAGDAPSEGSDSADSADSGDSAESMVPIWVDAGLSTDVTDAPLEWLERNLMSLEAHKSAAEGEWLIWLAEFDRQKGFAHWGMRSTAEWLDARVGMSPTAGRERVRVAKALTDLPKLREALVAGRITYSKVRAIIRVAVAETESIWLGLALDSTASQLEQLCAGVPHPDDAQDPSGAALRSQRVVFRNNGDATRTMTSRLPVDAAAIVEDRIDAQVEVIIDRACNGKASETSRRDFIKDHGGLAALRAVALVELIDGREQSGNDSLPPATVTAIVDTRPTAIDIADPSNSRSADSSADADGENDSAESFSGVRPQFTGRAVTETDTTPITAGTRIRTGPGFTISTKSGGPVAIGEAVMRRLSCDATTLDIALVTETGTPSDTTKPRGKRYPTPTMRAAVLLRDGGCCQYPGCTSRFRLHLHHVEHRIDGGPTQPDNLIAICSFHHPLFHEGGYKIELSRHNQSPRFTRPDGIPVTIPTTSGHTHELYNNTDSRPIDTPTAQDIEDDLAEAPGYNGIGGASDQNFDLAWQLRRLRGVTRRVAEQRARTSTDDQQHNANATS